MRERDVEKHLVKQATEAGMLVRKVAWIGRRNAPDRVLMGAGKTVWVEVKAPGEKPRPGQLREHKLMRAAGQRVEVVDTLRAVDMLLLDLVGERA